MVSRFFVAITSGASEAIDVAVCLVCSFLIGHNNGFIGLVWLRLRRFAINWEKVGGDIFMGRVLVTGANGFVGSAAVVALQLAGWDVCGCE